MTLPTQTHHPFILRKLDTCDFDSLIIYLNGLSSETRKRFGPHPFDRQSVIDFYNDLTTTRLGYIAMNMDTNDIIAYAIIKTGYLEHDRARLEAFGLTLDQVHDVSFAPSVADHWQGKGIGSSIFQFILTDLRTRDIQRIILWGGVQADNERAVNYYIKHGFIRLGKFEHNGLNYDMILNLP